MLLALDAGNTNITIGAFDGEKLAGRERAACEIPSISGCLLHSIKGYRVRLVDRATRVLLTRNQMAF